MVDTQRGEKLEENVDEGHDVEEFNFDSDELFKDLDAVKD